MSKARNIANSGTALGSVSSTELGYLDGVTSAVQTQIDNVLPTVSGNSGKYLTTNGTTKSWGTVSQYSLPSMSGKAGKYLTTDGTVESWADAAKSTEIYDLLANKSKWLNSGFTSTGNYNVVLSSGTGYLWTYASNGDLLQEFALSTAASIAVISTAFSRLVAFSTTNSDLSITPVPSKITTAGGTLSMDILTAGTGTYGVGSGTIPGGESGYIAGQLAHVLLLGGGGGGGGNSGNWPYPGGGSGGYGFVTYTTTPIALTGTYTITVGAAGSGTAPNGGYPGGDGGASIGFGLTANGGQGGHGGGNGYAISDGYSSMPANTNIFLAPSYAKLGGGTPGVGSQYNAGTGGTAGKIFVLRWTP